MSGPGGTEIVVRVLLVGKIYATVLVWVIVEVVPVSPRTLKGEERVVVQFWLLIWLVRPTTWQSMTVCVCVQVEKLEDGSLDNRIWDESDWLVWLSDGSDLFLPSFLSGFRKTVKIH